MEPKGLSEDAQIVVATRCYCEARCISERGEPLCDACYQEIRDAGLLPELAARLMQLINIREMHKRLSSRTFRVMLDRMINETQAVYDRFDRDEAVAAAQRILSGDD